MNGHERLADYLEHIQQAAQRQARVPALQAGRAVGGKRRGKQRLRLERVPLHVGRAINEVWSMDFVSDSLAGGWRIKCLSVTDDFSHECVGIAVDHGMGGESVVRVLDQVARFRGYPQAVRTDQGPVFTRCAFMAWARAKGVRPYPQPAGQAHAEWLHRELQWQVPRRVPERAWVPKREAGARRGRALAVGLQPGPAAQQLRAHAAWEVRGGTSTDNRRRHAGTAANPGVICFNPADSSNRLVRVLGAGHPSARSTPRTPDSWPPSLPICRRHVR